MSDTDKIRSLELFTYEIAVALDAGDEVAEKLLTRGYTFAVTPEDGYFIFHLNNLGASVVRNSFNREPKEVTRG